MTKEQLAELKQELKKLAANIKVQKPAFRKMQSAIARCTPEAPPSVDELYKAMHDLWRAKNDFRHKHIVYCLIRGRSRDEIERPSESNMPDENYIKTLLTQYEMPIKLDKDFKNHIDWTKSEFVPKRARKETAKEKLIV